MEIQNSNKGYLEQGRHGQFFAGSHISGVLLPPLSILQNPGKASRPWGPCQPWQPCE